jgi:hypothetical protein
MEDKKMAKDIENIMKEVIKNNKELHGIDNGLSKDISELKKGMKNIESKLNSMDRQLSLVLEILESFTLILDEEEEKEAKESWTPYDNADEAWQDEASTYDDDDDTEEL